jgi:hypothetical protein
MRKLERLSHLQQQLIRKRNQISNSLSDVLETLQSVVDLLVWLFLEGAKYSFREPMLDSMSDDTAMTLIMAPSMLILDIFDDILSHVNSDQALLQTSHNEAFPSGPSTLSFEAGTLDPAILKTIHSYGQSPQFSLPTPSSLGPQLDGFGMRDPVRQYLLISMLEYHLDRLKHASDIAVAAFPQMQIASGLQSILMGNFRERIDAVRITAGQASEESKLAGMR